MPETTSLPAGLPPTLSIAIIILTTVVSLAPKFFAMFSNFSGGSRAFKREKERLDLLKLRYEIEAFKREKNLEDLTEPGIEEALKKTLEDMDLTKSEIEALKKTFEDDLTKPGMPLVPERSEQRVVGTRIGEPLPFKISFLFGTIGAASPTILTVAAALFWRHSTPVFFSMVYWIAVILSSCVMGVLASF